MSLRCWRPASDPSLRRCFCTFVSTYLVAPAASHGRFQGPQTDRKRRGSSAETRLSAPSTSTSTSCCCCSPAPPPSPHALIACSPTSSSSPAPLRQSCSLCELYLPSLHQPPSVSLAFVTMRFIFPAVALAALCGASHLTPPVLPLTVRNPYFSTWLNDAREEPWSRWPMFWTGEEVRTYSPSHLVIRRL